MKKIFISFFLAFTMISTIVYAGNLVKKVYFSPYPILIDGEGYSSEMPILQYQERTYVALREFSEMVGVEVDFKDDVIIIETKELEREDFEKIEDEIENEKTKEDTLESENSSSNSNSKIVYVSKSGKKYHKLSNCNSATYYEITLSEAIKEGYTPCLRCANTK
mgnify:CR=1 FL=1